MTTKASGSPSVDATGIAAPGSTAGGPAETEAGAGVVAARFDPEDGALWSSGRSGANRCRRVAGRRAPPYSRGWPT